MLIRTRSIPAANIIKTKPCPITKVQTISDAFKFFLTNEILEEVVIQINRYAKQYFDQNQRSKIDFNAIKSKSSKWKPIDLIELESLIGLVIQAVFHTNNHESLHDLCGISRSSPLYRAAMSLQCFRQFLHFVRFDDR